MKILSRFLFLIFITFILAACCSTQCPHEKPRFTNPCEAMVYNLNRQGAVQIIPRGDTLRILLPVDNFFEPASNKIRLEAEPTLNQIGQLVQCGCYNEMPIRVLGFTDNIGTISQQKARTSIQAKNIASYLWANGVPLNRMSARNFGARGTLSSNSTPRGEADNRRVEIRIP